MQKVYYRDWRASRLMPFAFLFSRAAAPLSGLLAYWGMNPNKITLAAAICGSLSVVAVAVGSWGWAAVGLLAFLVLDHCDGQVARATNRRTSLGGYLDGVADLLTDLFFLGAITAWGIFHDTRVALLGLGALVSYCALELMGRLGGWALVLEALRAKDFTPSQGLPTIRGWRSIPLVPHRDLNVVVLVAGLLSGLLAWSLAALTVWWSAWTLYRVAMDSDRPKRTAGVLHGLAHEDNH